jgi:SNW domain-containing protein 1
VHINENFSKMAEALSIAERKAREAVEARSQMELRIAQNKKTEKEKQMREIAMKARQERTEMKKVHGDERQSEEVKERDNIRRDLLDEHRKVSPSFYLSPGYHETNATKL